MTFRSSIIPCRNAPLIRGEGYAIMPSIMKRTSLLIMISIFALSVSAGFVWAETHSLYEKYSRASEVKIFIGQPKEVAISGKIDTTALKKALEKALSERKSIHFKIVESATEAVISIEVDLQGYYFSEHDPVDMLIGVGMAAMDAAKQDHFVRLEADCRVLDAKGGQVLWKDRLTASITDEKMTEDEAKLMILDRTADVFIRSAFGKKKNR